MAAWLNEWCADFAAEHPRAIHSGTFFGEPSAAADVRQALEAGARIFKVHLQVGGFDPTVPELDAAWGLLAEAGVPVVVHCGSGPLPGAHTGPGPIGAVLRRHPALTLVIAHAGAPEYAEHLELALRYPNVRLDTTMVGTPFMNRLAPIPPDTLARYRDAGRQDRAGQRLPEHPVRLRLPNSVASGLGLRRGLAAERAVAQRGTAARAGAEQVGRAEGAGR